MGLFVVGVVAPVKATTFSIDLVDGDWENSVPVPPDVTIVNSGPAGGLSTARWGTTTGDQSGYDFSSRVTPFDAESDGTAFALGTFTHHNFPIGQPVLDSIEISMTMEDLGIFNLVTTFDFDHDETPNTGGPVNDIVTIANPIVNVPFAFDGQDYYFNLFGFSQDGGNTLKTEFSTVEGEANIAELYARITERPVSIPEPSSVAMLLTGASGLLGFCRLYRKAHNI